MTRPADRRLNRRPEPSFAGSNTAMAAHDQPPLTGPIHRDPSIDATVAGYVKSSNSSAKRLATPEDELSHQRVPIGTAANPDREDANRDPDAKRDASVEAASGGDHDPMLGALVGRFRLDAVIASGGMGTVYRATQIEPVRRTVAIKMIRPAWRTQPRPNAFTPSVKHWR